MFSNVNNEVPHFPMEIRENDTENAILKIVTCVRPDWDTAKIHTKFLTDGITNKLVLCSNEKEQVLVRIYGHKTDLLIDRKAEIQNIKLLHKYELAPTLYATFTNGLVYQFIPGNTLTADDVTKPEIYNLVAKEMAKMHKMPNKNKNPANLWSKLQQFVDLVPDEFQDVDKQKRFAQLNFSKQDLLAEIREIREALEEFDMLVVFCHNDLLLGNVILNKTKNKVFFIDFEYAGFNYQPFDIGNHFVEFAGVTDMDFTKFPKKQQQLDWLRTYLMEFKNVPEISEEEVENLYIQVNKFVLATHLFWFAWALIQAVHSHIDFDFIEYAALRLDEYKKKKPELLSLQ